MYLVRKIRKTGQVQVYSVNPEEPSQVSPGRTRKRAARAWVFNKGLAALDDTVVGALVRIEMLEDEHALPRS
jgi:hypothetical protein